MNNNSASHVLKYGKNNDKSLKVSFSRKVKSKSGKEKPKQERNDWNGHNQLANDGSCQANRVVASLARSSPYTSQSWRVPHYSWNSQVADLYNNGVPWSFRRHDRWITRTGGFHAHVHYTTMYKSVGRGISFWWHRVKLVNIDKTHLAISPLSQKRHCKSPSSTALFAIPSCSRTCACSITYSVSILYALLRKLFKTFLFSCSRCTVFIQEIKKKIKRQRWTYDDNRSGSWALSPHHDELIASGSDCCKADDHILLSKPFRPISESWQRFAEVPRPSSSASYSSPIAYSHPVLFKHSADWNRGDLPIKM